MAKRSNRRNKNKNASPNLPQETLDRARRQLAGEDVDNNEQDDTAEVKASSEDKVARSKRRSERRSSRRKSGSSATVQQFGQRSKRKKDGLDNEAMEELLANPTKFVTEEELREEYNFVLLDLRNMGMLAAVLMVLLVGLAQFI